MGFLGKLNDYINNVKKKVENTKNYIHLLYSKRPSFLGGNPFETAYYAKLNNKYNEVPYIFRRIYNTTERNLQKYKKENPTKYKRGVKSLFELSPQYKKYLQKAEETKKGLYEKYIGSFEEEEKDMQSILGYNKVEEPSDKKKPESVSKETNPNISKLNKSNNPGTTA